MGLQSGKICLYRVFDVGPDFKLDLVQQNLRSSGVVRFQLAKSNRDVVIRNAPLRVNLDSLNLNICGTSYQADVSAKIWSFGAISVCFQVQLTAQTSWQSLVEVAQELDQETSITDQARSICETVLSQIDPTRIKNLSLTTFEDYTVFFFKSLPGAETSAMKVFDHYDVHRLIFSEPKEILSDSLRKSIDESTLQYSQNDLSIITWNSALIIEPSGLMDIPDMIEFALCQLLEMRHYDDLLDEKLGSLYSALEKKRISIWETYSEKLSREAAQVYLEISDTVESVENSLKVVGDYYLAQIFRLASSRFRFYDWRNSVDKKLNNLAEVSKLITSDINERRNQILELVIIALISIELLPYLGKLF